MNEQINILLVEDDYNLGFVIQDQLKSQGYTVHFASDGVEGLKKFNESTVHMCIFDVMMPKKDGISLAKDVREKDQNVPIIFLTAKTMKEDIIKGFQAGADDYIPKPFAPEELLYRIKAVLKRSQKPERQNQEVKEFNIGKYHFNYPLRILTFNETDKDKLSPKESELLRMFCLYMNDILPRSIALKEIWGEDNYFTARSMDVFVTKLRKYLKKDDTIEIVNIHGNGFQLRVSEEQGM